MATQEWLGAAVPVKQLETITIGGTWAASDTLTITINGKDLVLTIGSTVTLATVLDNMHVMLSGSGSFDAGYSSNALGSDVGEFSSLTYEDEGATDIEVTGMSSGRPFTLTVAKSSASGTISTSTTTTATGPHHFDNVDNWSQGSVPVDSDDIKFNEKAAASLLFALDNNGVTPTSIVVEESFPKSLHIGLPAVNVDDASNPYDEPLETFLKLGNTGDATNTKVTIEASGQQRIQIDSGTGQVTWKVTGRTLRTDLSRPSTILKGSHASNVADIERGDVLFEGATIATLQVGWTTNLNTDSVVICDDDCTLTTLTQTGGTVTVSANTTTVNKTGGELIIQDQLDDTAVTATTINNDGGTLEYRATGTATTINNRNGATLDFRQGVGAVTVTNCTMTAGCSYYDPQGRVTHTNGIDLYGTTTKGLVAFEHAPHRTVSFSTI